MIRRFTHRLLRGLDPVYYSPDKSNQELYRRGLRTDQIAAMRGVSDRKIRDDLNL